MEAIRQTIVVVELTKNLHRVFSGVMLAKQDKLANRMGANVYQDGKAVNLDGYAVKGYFIRNGTETIVIENGSIHGNQAYVELPGNCYFYEGSYTLTIKLVKDNVEQTLVIFDGQIAETITDAIVENESVINVADFIQQDWLHRIETAAETALEQASIATESAAAAEEAWHGVQGGLAQKAPGIQIDASGEMVSIADGAEMPVASLITHVEPLQSGSGDPSPDNVRAISGWDEVSVTRAGKNLAAIADKSTTSFGVAIAIEAGVITMNGTSTSTSSRTVLLWKSVLKPGTYTLSHNVLTGDMVGAPENGSVLMCGSQRTRLNAPATTITVEAEEEYSFSVVQATPATTYDNFAFSVQLEKGSTATDFEPPNVQSLTAALPETVYGFDINWTTGLVTVNKAVYNLSSVATWKKLTDKNVYYCSNPADMLPASGWGNDDLPVCSHFVYQPTGTMADGSYKVSDKIYIQDQRPPLAS